MGNSNKRGYKNSKSYKTKSQRQVVMSELKKPSLNSSTGRQTRSTGSGTNEPKKNNEVPTGQGKGGSDDLLAMMKGLQNQLEQMKEEVKVNQRKSAKELQETLEESKTKYQDLKKKYKEKKIIVANLNNEMNEKDELIKDAQQKITLLEAEDDKKKKEITDLKDKIIDLTKRADELCIEISNKLKEQASLLDDQKKKFEDAAAQEKEKYEESLRTCVPKAEYNSLVDEYEKLKTSNELTQRRLSKVISDKKAVEKSKLELIRQKHYQTDEFVDMMRTFKNELKPRSSNPVDDRTYNQSGYCSNETRFTRDHSNHDERPSKKFKHYY